MLSRLKKLGLNSRIVTIKLRCLKISLSILSCVLRRASISEASQRNISTNNNIFARCFNTLSALFLENGKKRVLTGHKLIELNCHIFPLVENER